MGAWNGVPALPGFSGEALPEGLDDITGYAATDDLSGDPEAGYPEAGRAETVGMDPVFAFRFHQCFFSWSAAFAIDDPV
jgi:hypothetical protein